ncbi:DUF3050 domain-containing protein [Dyadobacter flavalbus]|uniref:DUF3050 domain-containing protein n=1 Tax=Dyadobacter flavalbus TaxID=2579942 RepID=A0A5M8R353_9BACT|nr:DUF3050 domain-containing protein [Dyadobacter flavalbus]KAA6441424.1 DUF3050 domain-containing protein [Dyadobacter flavalbus]
MENYIEQIQKSIEPLRHQIINHKVYAAIQDIESLGIFMQYHAYAVWDFMSLLKSLQNNLTCTAVPWFPKGSPESRYLINEIVLGEESDVDMEGNRKSHFELYLEAMCQCGADTAPITGFISELMQNGELEQAFQKAGTPEKAAQFVSNTFEIIGSNKDYVQAAVFTFGREDLIPDMFHSIINDLHAHFPERISIFKYYLERHIEVDGDHHSHLALQMTSNLCGTNEEYWQEATEAVKTSLQKRIELWDGVYDTIMARKQVTG